MAPTCTSHLCLADPCRSVGRVGPRNVKEDSMRSMSLVAIGAFIAAAPCLAGAQRTSLASDAKASPPTGEMQTLIKALAGHWSLKLKFEPSKESPRGLESTGEESWHAD